MKLLELSALPMLFLLASSLSCSAEQPSSPMELATTAQLNKDIAAANAKADARYRAEQQDYLRRKAENDALQEAYQRDKQENDRLRQEYETKLEAYRRAISPNPR